MESIKEKYLAEQRVADVTIEDFVGNETVICPNCGLELGSIEIKIIDGKLAATGNNIEYFCRNCGETITF